MHSRPDSLYVPQEFGRKFKAIISGIKGDIVGLETDLEKGLEVMDQMGHTTDANFAALHTRMNDVEADGIRTRKKLLQLQNWIWNLQCLEGSGGRNPVANNRL